MATKIFPSANDINGGTTGNGKTLKEASFAQLISLLTQNTNRIISGFSLPSTDPDLTISIPAGSAIVAGRFVIKDTPENLVLTASTTNHIYLQIVLDGSNNATSANFVANTTGTPPSNSIKLGIAITGASTVTSSINSGQIFGIGTSPDTDHDAALQAVQEIGEWGLTYSHTDSSIGIVRNAKIVGGQWIYRNSGREVQRIYFTDGGITFDVAPAGTAGLPVTLTGKASIPTTFGQPMTYEGKTVRHDGNIFHGRVLGNGAVTRLPPSWSVTRTGVGLYTITHNLGHINYTINLTTNQGGIVMFGVVDGTSSINDFYVKLSNISGTLTDQNFGFSVILD